MRRALRFPQRDGDAPSDSDIRLDTFAVSFSYCGDRACRSATSTSRLDSQRHLHVFFVGDGDVDEFHQFPHHFGGRLAPFPKIFAIVQIAGDGDSLLRACFTASRARSAAETLRAGVMPVM